ncbi:Ubiquitin carboxyl-terminal hydrolase-like protein [Hapsidospora chrysogenum ATCC 11550]|uniref:Ubiquitin carboxyl-terminal hydrolase n=1 Tax=Hapsidospora chrysogenum (strain ATCC 11550 / CBS 779.69 / DSM 880 / IAM 14645 / JCM 23072 / IMI 49137) TaxID=857340 RepID=A0A086TF93_HAPC1|nr:Ubiquitin carboxyl-terminal hydrolase-like protein [Hapsidospora chrysogenum ATCC 11550]
MYNKPATVASYAAGASLAAITLIYVFGPTFTLDSDASSSSRKKTIVGLRNAANDCFINSVLQVLAGLDDLRIYLIRETHRRRIEDPAVYAYLVQPDDDEQGGARAIPDWKLRGLQDGLVTYGLKDMLDALNERPIYKKSITPFPLVRVLETAFRQRISRQQQDAQEFLQIVAERLKDEYHAGRRARLHARTHGLLVAGHSGAEEEGDDNGNEKADDDGADEEKTPVLSVSGANDVNGASSSTTDVSTTGAATPEDTQPRIAKTRMPAEVEEPFPMEGRYESQLQCMACRYRSKPREETFCTLTLAVPQVSSTSLSTCFDGIFKTEYIDDFKCENCRLLATIANLEHELSRSTSEAFRKTATESIEKLRAAVETDPEHPPEGVELIDSRYAPKRRISKTTRMTIFPKILAIHLSRSIYGVGQATQKNSARVSFPEHLPLGGLADQRKYRLLGVVTHRGGHNSGHYEAFRRQSLPRPPFANLNTFQASEVYSKTPTPISTPDLRAKRLASPAVSTPDLLSGNLTNSSTPSLESMATTAAPPRTVAQEQRAREPANHREKERDSDTGSLRSVAASTKSALSRLGSPRPSGKDGTHSPRQQQQQQQQQQPSGPKAKASQPPPAKRRKPPAEKWWRVSDEKVREAKTSDVLGMQREVYLLFYEVEKES